MSYQLDVPRQDLDAEVDHVTDSLALRMCGGPQLQVLDAVVVPDFVPVVDHLVLEDGSPQLERHHQTVLADFSGTAHEITEMPGHGYL